MIDRTEANARRRWIWIGLVATFYLGWALTVAHHNAFSQLPEHYPVAIAMLFGSFIAGSTPMGGGVVGFPVLVLIFDEPVALGRDFSFAIQSVGMTSAAVYILCAGREVAWRSLRWALLGSLIGTPLGLVLFAPHVPALVVQMLFAVLCGAFGLFTLFGLWTGATASRRIIPPSSDGYAGLLCGLLGGFFVASVTGIGADEVLYIVLLTLCGVRPHVAIPTSVLLMAFTSLVGISVRLLTGGPVAGTFANWLAAAPVVALGAPLGALVVARLPRTVVLGAVGTLCVAQGGWFIHDNRAALGPSVAFATIAIITAGAIALARWQARGTSIAAWDVPLVRQSDAGDAPELT